MVAVASFAVGPIASADVIMNQIGSMDGANTAGQNVSASQDFDVYGAYDVVAIDDFTIGSAMNLTSASMVLSGWNGFSDPMNITGYTVSIFSSVEAAGNSIYGDIASIYLINGVDPGISYSPMWGGDGSWLVSFDMSGVSLSAGSYWIGVTPLNSYADGNGQTGVVASDIGDNSGAQANPTGAFGFITQATGANYAYSLEGTGVPAPGALVLLGLAGIASRRRRR